MEGEKGEGIPHVDTEGSEGGCCGIKAVSKLNRYIDDLGFVEIVLAPLGERVEEGFDGD